MIAHSFKPAYVARGAITTPQEINKLKGYIRNAFQAQLNHEGYSLVEVLSTCPTNWAMSPLAAHKRLTEEVARIMNSASSKREENERCVKFCLPVLAVRVS